MNQISLTISNKASERIRKIVDSEDDGYIPGLVYAREEWDEADGTPISRFEGWMVERYKRDEIESVEDSIYLIDGVEFFFFQKHLLADLEGKSLDYRDGRFLVK